MVYRCKCIFLYMIFTSYSSVNYFQTQRICKKEEQSQKMEYLPYFWELKQVDEELCDKGERLVNSVFANTPMTKKHPEAVRNHIYLAGSLTEQGTIARFFQNNEKFLHNLNRELEADFNFDVFEIPEGRKNVIHEIQNKIGYVEVKVDLEIVKTSRNLGWNVEDDYLLQLIDNATTTSGLLQPHKFKEFALGIVVYRSQFVELIIAAALNKWTRDIEVTVNSQEVTGSTVASNFLLKVDKKPFLTLGFDTAPLIRLPWWPSIGNEWKWRQRKWPSQEKIDEMSSICYLIGKPFDTHDIKTTEFRYSFGHIERELVRMRSKHQNLVYLLFKIMLYKWIKPINSDKISSYIAKTIMFWTCEQFPPDHEMWREDFTGITKTLSYLFKQMQKSFDEMYLECYFVKEIDIIKRVPLEDKKKASEKVKEILEDVEKYLPFPIDKELTAGREIVDAIKSTSEILEEWKKGDFKRLLRQPKLTLDFLYFYIYGVEFRKLKERFYRQIGVSKILY